MIAIGGGVAVFAGPGSPTNKMIGVGFGPDPTVEDLERVEAAFASRAAIDHRLVGGGALRFDDRIAQLCGAATLPAFRRRGVQSAVLRWRLNRARSAGCQAAVVTTQPASKSQQNVQREGFHLLYARQLLVKTP